MQLLKTAICYCGLLAVCAQARADWNPATDAKRNVDDSVSYTHLTLPTILRV